MTNFILNFIRCIESIFTNKAANLTADLFIFLYGAHAMTKSMFPNLSGVKLLKHVIGDAVVIIPYLVTPIKILIVAALVYKAMNIIFSAKSFSKKHSAVKPKKIVSVLEQMNREIENHINVASDKKDSLTGKADIDSIQRQHNYQLMLNNIVERLREQIRESLIDKGAELDDILISLYVFNPMKKTLTLQACCYEQKDLILSKTIVIDERKYEEYECVKAMKNDSLVTYVHDKKKYFRSTEKKKKTFRHYIGCKIATESTILGYINIEFHNKVLFVDEKEMQDFYFDNIAPYKLLSEYQFLKSWFIHTLVNFSSFWASKS